MKRRTVFTYLVCPCCANVVVIHRRYKRQKELGHIKDLWCYRCKAITKHVEYKTDYAAERATEKMRRMLGMEDHKSDCAVNNEPAYPAGDCDCGYTSEVNAQIENNFSYHAPKPGQPAKYELIRGTAKILAYRIDTACPNSREKSLAMTKLEEAVFWANASIARN